MALTKERICVVGAGIMGQGIAQSFALGGWSPLLVDQTLELAERGRSEIGRSLSAGVLAGRISQSRADDTMARVRTSGDLGEACSAADVILEAVPEALSVKHEVWSEVSAGASPDALLGTNTSALDIDAIAKVLSAPERFLGVHWYNPAQLIPGVEIVPGRATTQQTVQRFHSLLTVVGKRPFVVRNHPGFVGNRLQFALIAEAFRCLEEGVASAEDIDEIARSTFGIRLGDFGPIRLADMGGLDTYVAVLSYLTQTLGDRFEVPAVLQGLVDAGALGVKSGHGVFPYSAADASELYSRRDAALARRLDTAVTEMPALTEREIG